MLIRHAEPDPAPGQSDPPLSDLGRRQAEALRRRFTAEPVSAVYSSTLQRAVQTAQLAFPGFSVRQRQELCEWDLPVAFAAAAARTDGPIGAREVSAELEGFAHTVTEEVRRIGSEHRTGTVAVVCHGGVINAVVSRVQGCSLVASHLPDHASCWWFDTSGDRWRLVVENDTGHLTRP